MYNLNFFDLKNDYQFQNVKLPDNECDWIIYLTTDFNEDLSGIFWFLTDQLSLEGFLISECDIDTELGYGKIIIGRKKIDSSIFRAISVCIPDTSIYYGMTRVNPDFGEAFLFKYRNGVLLAQTLMHLYQWEDTDMLRDFEIEGLISDAENYIKKKIDPFFTDVDGFSRIAWTDKMIPYKIENEMFKMKLEKRNCLVHILELKDKNTGEVHIPEILAEENQDEEDTSEYEY